MTESRTEQQGGGEVRVLTPKERFIKFITDEVEALPDGQGVVRYTSETPAFMPVAVNSLLIRKGANGNLGQGISDYTISFKNHQATMFEITLDDDPLRSTPRVDYKDARTSISEPFFNDEAHELTLLAHEWGQMLAASEDFVREPARAPVPPVEV